MAATPTWFNETTLQAFPRITSEKTMSEAEFARAYGQFVYEYYEAVAYAPNRPIEAKLHAVLMTDLREHPQRHSRLHAREYVSSLKAIAGAATLKLHLMAREASEPRITVTELSSLIHRYESSRTFVRLDESGNCFAILA